MKIPSFNGLRHSASYATKIHPEPRFYKYYWWVFWEGSPCEGREFLSDAHRLSTAAAAALMDRLHAEDKPYLLYNTRQPRRDPDNTPFDPASDRWAGVTWAPAFDDDKDELWQGFK